MSDVKFEWRMDEFERAVDSRVERLRLVTPSKLRDSVAHFELQIWGELMEHEHPPGTRTPSPPGGFPGNITGRLGDSLTTRGISFNASIQTLTKLAGNSSWSVTFGPTAVYARIQELGGWTGKDHKSHLPARPYFRPGMTSQWAVGAFLRGMKEVWSSAWSR